MRPPFAARTILATALLALCALSPAMAVDVGGFAYEEAV